MRGYKDKKRGDHPCWKGGRIKDKDGYVAIYAPDHPWPRKMRYIREHIVVMELHIGRRLTASECVHHKDNNRENNALENLEVMNKGEHIRMHRAVDKHLQERDSRGRFKCGSI